MGEDKAKEFLDRIYKATAAKELHAIRVEIIQAKENKELSEDVERGLLAAVDDRLVHKGHLPVGNR